MFSKIIFFCCSALSSNRNFRISFKHWLILFSIIICFPLVSLHWFLIEIVDFTTLSTFSCCFFSPPCTSFISLPCCLLFSCTCWISLLYILSIPFLSFARSSFFTKLTSSKVSVLTNKPLIIYSFKALTSFEVSVILLSELLRKSFILCMALLVAFSCSCSRLRPSRTFFISLPNWLVLFSSFPIPWQRKSSSSFLYLPGSFSSSK